LPDEKKYNKEKEKKKNKVNNKNKKNENLLYKSKEEKKNEQKDNIQENEEENSNCGILYKYKSDDDKVYYYLFHRKINNKIDLLCKEYKCHGTASLDENEIITIKKNVFFAKK